MAMHFPEAIAGEETDELFSWYSYNDRDWSPYTPNDLANDGSIEKFADRLEVGHFRHNTTILAITICRKSLEPNPNDWAGVEACP
jgi:hypothetical protein